MCRVLRGPDKHCYLGLNKSKQQMFLCSPSNSKQKDVFFCINQDLPAKASTNHEGGRARLFRPESNQSANLVCLLNTSKHQAVLS